MALDLAGRGVELEPPLLGTKGRAVGVASSANLRGAPRGVGGDGCLEADCEGRALV